MISTGNGEQGNNRTSADYPNNCTIIPIVIGPFGTVTKKLVQGMEELEIRGRGKTIQTTALLELARILRRLLDT